MNKRRRDKIEKRKKLKAWSDNIRESYNYKCFVPGCSIIKKLNAHHVIPKEIQETKFDLKNGVSLCPGHHKFKNFSAHKNPLWFINLLRELEPGKYQYLSSKIQEVKMADDEEEIDNDESDDEDENEESDEDED
jgi:hypothetical protein